MNKRMKRTKKMPDVCHAKTKDLPGMRNHIQMYECVFGIKFEKSSLSSRL